jgi:hypothetical protein
LCWTQRTDLCCNWPPRRAQGLPMARPGPRPGVFKLGAKPKARPQPRIRDNPAGPPRRHGRQCPARDQDRGLRRCQRGPHDSDARRGCRKVGLALSEATSWTHGGDHRGSHSPRHSVATCTAGRAEWPTAVGFTMLTSMASGPVSARRRARRDSWRGSPRPVRLCACSCRPQTRKCPHSCSQLRLLLSWLRM